MYLNKKYSIDIAFIALAAALAFIFAGRPDTGQKAYTPAKEATKRELVPENKKEKKQTEIKIRKTDSAEIEKRNIFSEDGSYETVKNVSIPENPYRLVAILKGNEKKAVFREHTGSFVILKAGQKLLDGAVIELIDNVSVQAKKGGVTKEYRIFDVRPKDKSKIKDQKSK